MIKYTVVFALLLIGLYFLLGLPSPVETTIGVIFGVIVSVVNFSFLANTLQSAVAMSPRQAESYTVRRYFIRYIIYGVTIFLAIQVDLIGIIGTVLGLSLMKVVIYTTNLLDDKEFYKNIFKRKEV
jgi:hypothetical protein